MEYDPEAISRLLEGAPHGACRALGDQGLQVLTPVLVRGARGLASGALRSDAAEQKALAASLVGPSPGAARARLHQGRAEPEHPPGHRRAGGGRGAGPAAGRREALRRGRGRRDIPREELRELKGGHQESGGFDPDSGFCAAPTSRSWTLPWRRRRWRRSTAPPSRGTSSLSPRRATAAAAAAAAAVSTAPPVRLRLAPSFAATASKKDENQNENQNDAEAHGDEVVEVAVRCSGRACAIGQVAHNLLIMARAAAVYEKVARALTSDRTDYQAVLGAWGQGFWSELDFQREAASQQFFKNEVVPKVPSAVRARGAPRPARRAPPRLRVD